jgi:uncharacterized protein YbjQ (UPF0145 family)
VIHFPPNIKNHKNQRQNIIPPIFHLKSFTIYQPQIFLIMLIVTTPSIPGTEIEETLGMVRGSTTRARFFGRDVVAGLKMLVGGEISEYTELLMDARDQSTDRMIEEAERLGANAIVNVRFTTSSIARGASEILAYGTAVRIKV